ncbi:MAG: hypothetical protein A3E01_00275 [Gammaproteobacteria bacterium RIFCSPHIGHO2_12_FULL_63_22]|nr:MAG: hypothetical protein A3E01_00275 [Gammaproteobacteria bacterium RIFCSPHIGHO2_12_FULL_63_22]
MSQGLIVNPMGHPILPAALLAENERLRAALKQIHAGDTMRGRELWTQAEVIQEHYRIASVALED